MSLIFSHKVSIHLTTVIQHFYSPILFSFFFVSSTVSCVRYSFECSCYIFHHVSQNTLPTSLPQSFLSKLPSNLRAAHYAVGNHHCNFERFLVVQIVIPYTTGKIVSSNFRMVPWYFWKACFYLSHRSLSNSEFCTYLMEAFLNCMVRITAQWICIYMDIWQTVYETMGQCTRSGVFPSNVWMESWVHTMLTTIIFQYNWLDVILKAKHMHRLIGPVRRRIFTIPTAF